jgi:uncharacterized protein
MKLHGGTIRFGSVALVFALTLAGCARIQPAAPAARAASEEAIHVASGDVTLAGTLVLPAGAGRLPAVVLFHGSGPQERDLFTARWFEEQGVVALAYDKRGVGESTGNFRKVPFMELCDDGLAAIAYLKTREEVDPKRIGVWGLSQGGWLGPLAASRSADVAWVIAVSGPGVSPGEQMIVYYANELRAQGVPENQVQDASSLRREVWSYLSSAKGYEQAKEDMDRARTKPWYARVKAQQDQLFDPLPTPAEVSKPDYPWARWFQHEMIYDPVPALEALHVPALFLFGDQDQLIPVAKSVEVIREVQARGTHHDFTVQVFPGVDHGMHLTTSTGLDPEYHAAMRAWLAAHVLKTP